MNDLVCHRTIGVRLVYHRRIASDGVIALLKEPASMLTADNVRDIKRDAASEVTVVELDDRFYVIKHYPVRNLWHGCKNALRPSRAFKSWRSAHILFGAGIATAPPVAVLERRFGPVRFSSVYVSEYVDGVRGREFFADTGTPREEKEIVIHRLVAMFARLAEARISHGDMKATNIIIRDGQPVLIDLDALRVHRSRRQFRRAFTKDVERFIKNWRGEPLLAERFTAPLTRLIPPVIRQSWFVP